MQPTQDGCGFYFIIFKNLFCGYSPNQETAMLNNSLYFCILSFTPIEDPVHATVQKDKLVLLFITSGYAPRGL